MEYLGYIFIGWCFSIIFSGPLIASEPKMLLVVAASGVVFGVVAFCFYVLGVA